jgi:hypothetical protein
MLSINQAPQVEPVPKPQPHQASEDEYLTVVIRLPVSSQRRAIIEANLQVGSSFHGGTITSVLGEDAVTIYELMEDICEPRQIDEARARARELR